MNPQPSCYYCGCDLTAASLSHEFDMELDGIAWDDVRCCEDTWIS